MSQEVCQNGFSKTATLVHSVSKSGVPGRSLEQTRRKRVVSTSRGGVEVWRGEEMRGVGVKCMQPSEEAQETRLDLHRGKRECAIAGSFDDNEAVKQTRYFSK